MTAPLTREDILRAVDSCGGRNVDAESADWNRGYNEALEAAERELNRMFARHDAAVDPLPIMRAALEQIAKCAPVEKPDVRDEFGCWGSWGNYDDVARDAASEAEWHIAEIARKALSVVQVSA